MTNFPMRFKFAAKRGVILSSILIMIEIHPEAAENFNKKGLSLIPCLREYQDDSPRSNSFPSDIITSATITDKDIIDLKPIVLVNGFGETTGFYFIHNGNKIGRGGRW